MENNAKPASSPPPKPWERAGSSSGPGPFRPPSGGNTSEVVETSGMAQPGKAVTSTSTNVNRNTVGRPVPTRPWEQQTYRSTYGGDYASGQNNNSGYGSGMYGGLYGRVGGGYGGGLYGNNMYRGGYGGGVLGGPMPGYPNNPDGPPSPPSFWISLMRVMQGVIIFFGRVAFLIDQNTQAFHMLMTALVQLFDHSRMLYGELARFVLRILGIKTKPKKDKDDPPNMPGNEAAPSGGWDSVWGDAK